MSDQTFDLRIDFNTEDDTGLPWTYIDDAARARVVPGRYLIAGAGDALAVVEVVDIDDDGLVHVRPMRGTVESNRHLLGAATADS